MQSFYVWNFKKWKRWILIITIILFTVLFLWFEQRSTFSLLSSQETPVVLTKGDPSKETVALTFNISWGEEKVYDILEQLDRHDVRATFFISGEWAEKNPDILEDITDGNHELGMLGYRYKSYLEQDIEEVRKDLVQAKEIFSKLGYEDVTLLRAPHGHFNKDVVDLAKKLNFDIVHWNVNPNDWENPGKDVIIDEVLQETTNGDVILLHASDAVKQTSEALDTILPSLKNKGFSFTTLSQLFSQAEIETELIK